MNIVTSHLSSYTQHATVTITFENTVMVEAAKHSRARNSCFIHSFFLVICLSIPLRLVVTQP